MRKKTLTLRLGYLKEAYARATNDDERIICLSKIFECLKMIVEARAG